MQGTAANGTDRVRPIKALATLFGCVLSVVLWLNSPYEHYTAREEFAFAVNRPGLLVQATSHREALHLLVMRADFPHSATLSFQRVTYLGAAGYHHSYGVDLLGFVLAVLPHRYDGGDYLVSPYAALVLPYWFLAAVTGALFLKYAGWFARLKPFLRFSAGTLSFMAVAATGLLLLNLFPTETHHHGILRDHGFPFTCLRLAARQDEVLDFFMGYDLGWRPVKLGDNLFLASLVVLTVGVLSEWIRRRVCSPERGPEG